MKLGNTALLFFFPRKVVMSSGTTYLDAAQGALFFALVRRQLGGVVRVGVSTAAELSGLLLPLLDLLHVPPAALVVLQGWGGVGWVGARNRKTGADSCTMADGQARCSRV